MNRRTILIALAIVVPVAIFVAAKIAASWRPVAVARVNSDDWIFPMPAAATARAVLITPAWGTAKFFDLRSGASRISSREGIALGEAALWQLGRNKSQQQLVIRRDGHTPRAYKMPAPAFAATFGTRSNGIYMPPQVTINGGHINLLVGQWFCRWNSESGQLERARTCDIDGTFDENALALDGETIVNTQMKTNTAGFVSREVSTVSTRTGQRVPRFPVGNPGLFDLKLSPTGAYAISQPGNAPALTQWDIYDTATGKRLWSLPLNQTMETVVFSPDEKWVAVERTLRQIWEIRDARTGQVLRTLPLYYDTISGGFSTDGATLYSVADGVLYRQRAR